MFSLLLNKSSKELMFYWDFFSKPQLTVNDLIYPVFVMEGENQQEEIP